MSQREYTLDILDEAGLMGSKPTNMLMDPNVKLFVDQGELMTNLDSYRRLVGKLDYLTITRPVISFAVRVLSQFVSATCSSHWDAYLRIIRYLKAHLESGLLYRANSHLRVEAFTDADLARSTTRYCMFLGGDLVS